MYKRQVLNYIPLYFFRGLDAIYIGEFDFLKERDMQAIYMDSVIYLDNAHESEDDIIDDVIHELAHHIEENNRMYIYGDKKIENEFLQKRKKLWFYLEGEGFREPGLQDYLKVEYDVSFDKFLYQEVGYPTLSALTVNLFYSPYGATSLREYYANGFEAFFYHDDSHRLKNISPALYGRVVELQEKLNKERTEQ